MNTQAMMTGEKISLRNVDEKIDAVSVQIADKKNKINENLEKIKSFQQEIKEIKTENQFLEDQISSLLCHLKGHEEALKVKVEYSEQLSLNLTPIESLLSQP